MNDIIRLSNLEANILYIFVKNFDLEISILQITKEIKNHYANVYKTIKNLKNKNLMNFKTVGKATIYSLNKKSLKLPIYLAFVEELKSQDILLNKFPFLKRLVEEVKNITPINCIGIFGSHIDGSSNKKSDIDIFILVEKNKIKNFNNFIPKYFPEFENKIDLNMISFEEFIDSLKSKQFTLSREIIKNKLIISGAETYYNILLEAQR